MSRVVDILGIGAEGPVGLTEAARDRLEAATFLAGGRRHLALVGPTSAERFAITDNLAALVDRLRSRTDEERCVVLASGDPLCFGVGHRLGQDLGRDQIRVEPSVSSLQLAFARAGLSWQDASLASIHGRELASTLLPLLGRPKIGLFTQDGSSPSAVARFLVDRGLDDYSAWVGERLGTTYERVSQGRIVELIGRTFEDLNFLILERPVDSPAFTGPFAVPDDLFSQPKSGPILLTHQDVRAVTLARFHDLPTGPIWDLGAGLGGVSIDLARAFGGVEVVAFERSPDQASHLSRNRKLFAAYNLRVIRGEAPDCLVEEARPSGVFLGGTGGRLDAILDVVFDRLLEGGVLVANFVGLENLTRFQERVSRAAWPFELTQVQINQGRPLGGLTTLVPLRPVWIVQSRRPKDR
jgi:precorrin-6B C5,15-methyltransferase / cobalt-precorrin-6B C5,C15-methyltransferase